MLNVLRDRNFALLWSSRLVSTLGDWLLLIALPLYVLHLTDSALSTGLTLLSVTLPQVLFSPLAGALADRLDRRRVLIACDLLRAALLPGLLLVHSETSLWLLYTVTFGVSLTGQLFEPTAQALMPQLLGPQALVPAGALNASAQNATRLIGPALGGLVYSSSGLPMVVMADVISFVLSALLIVGVRLPAVGSTELTKQHLPRHQAGADWRLGWRRIQRNPTLRVLLLVDLLSSVKEGTYNVLGVVFVIEVLHAGATGRGLIGSAQALGGLIGGGLVGYAGHRWPPRWTIGLGLLGNGACLLTLFLLQSYPAALLLSALCGLPVAAAGIRTMTTLQSSAPPQMLGRVFGVFGAAGGLALLTSQGAASLLGERVGIVRLLSVGASFELLAGLVALAWLPLRRKANAAAVMLNPD